MFLNWSECIYESIYNTGSISNQLALYHKSFSDSKADSKKKWNFYEAYMTDKGQYKKPFMNQWEKKDKYWTGKWIESPINKINIHIYI